MFSICRIFLFTPGIYPAKKTSTHLGLLVICFPIAHTHSNNRHHLSDKQLLCFLFQTDSKSMNKCRSNLCLKALGICHQKWQNQQWNPIMRKLSSVDPWAKLIFIRLHSGTWDVCWQKDAAVNCFEQYCYLDTVAWLQSRKITRDFRCQNWANMCSSQSTSCRSDDQPINQIACMSIKWIPRPTWVLFCFY